MTFDVKCGTLSVRPSELGMCLLLLPLFSHILDRTTVGPRFSLAASSFSLLPEAPPSTFSYEANADPAAAETGSLKIFGDHMALRSHFRIRRRLKFKIFVY